MSRRKINTLPDGFRLFANYSHSNTNKLEIRSANVITGGFSVPLTKVSGGRGYY